MAKRKIDPRILRVADYEKSSGKSIREIANLIGVTDATIYCWKKGRKVSPLASVALDRFLGSIS
jgi:transposase